MSRTTYHAAGSLATAARRRRAAHLRDLQRVAVADMDVERARVALAEAEKGLSAARVAAGLDLAA